MSEALEARADIVEAINEYGSTINIISITKGDLSNYDPYNPTAGDSETSVTHKALIGSTATNENLNDVVDGYELSIRLYSAIPITKDQLVEFRDIRYEIVYVDEKILQDETLIYEVLVKR